MDTNDFTKLKVWQELHQFMLDCYKFCRTLPKEEQYITSDQLKRSSSSPSSNVAEGYGRYYYQDNISYCRIARGSLMESKNHLLKCRDLNFGNQEMCIKLLSKTDDICMLINGYIRHLNKQKNEKQINK